MLEYWTANIQSLTKIKLVDVISPATLWDASDGAGVPEEVPGRSKRSKLRRYVPQVETDLVSLQNERVALGG